MGYVTRQNKGGSTLIIQFECKGINITDYDYFYTSTNASWVNTDLDKTNISHWKYFYSNILQPYGRYLVVECLYNFQFLITTFFLKKIFSSKICSGHGRLLTQTRVKTRTTSFITSFGIIT